MLKAALSRASLAPSDYVAIAFGLTLMFVWYLPGTIAFRLALTVAMLALLLWKWRQTGGGSAFYSFHRFWLTYAALTAWIFVQALMFGVEKQIVLKEIWGQWIRSGATGLTGFLLASLFTRRMPRGGALLVAAVALPLFLHVGLHDLDMLWRWAREGHLPFQSTPFIANYAGISFLTNLLMSLLCAEGMVRLLYRHRYLPIANHWLGLLIALCFFATYTAGARHGTLGFLTLLLSCTVVGLIAKREAINLPMLAGTTLVVLAGIATFGGLAYKSDPRWLTLAETVPIALDTERYTAWRQAGDFPLPTLADGQPVSDSNYMRIAWAKEAALALVRHPLGVGFGRDSFGRAMLLSFPDYASSKHCHSGILNFAVGVGLPGLLLWLALLWLLATHGWQAFFRRENPAGLMLLLLVTGFTLRSVVDGNLQDHMFEQFMFLAMLFAVLANEEQRPVGIKGPSELE